MNKKIYIGIGIAIFVLLLIIFIPKYLNGNATANNNAQVVSGDIEKIEVYHFHATRQCSTCIAVGKLAEETTNTYFKDELKSGKLVFGSINIDLPENKELVAKYGATGSSLIIGVYGKDGSFSKQEDTAVWSKIYDKEDYMNYLKGVIEQKFLGE